MQTERREAGAGAGAGAGPGAEASLFSCVLEYVEARAAAAARGEGELQARLLRRAQRLRDFHERQRSDLVDLRRCLEYMNEHAHVIGAALRVAAGSESAGGVPLAAALIRDVAAMRRSMEQSISNATHIRNIVSVNHQPFMDNLLRRMENELSNWTVFLNGASRALVNSGALMENIHNLIAAQQKMCTEVASSELFQTVKDGEDEDSPQRDQLVPATAAHLSSTPKLDMQH